MAVIIDCWAICFHFGCLGKAFLQAAKRPWKRPSSGPFRCSNAGRVKGFGDWTKFPIIWGPIFGFPL